MNIGVILTFLSAGILVVQGANSPGEACTGAGAGTCANANIVCTSLICYCSTGYYDNDASATVGTCTAGIALNGDCSAPATTALKNTACSTITTNSECGTGDVCLCVSGYLGDGNDCNTQSGATVISASWKLAILSAFLLYWTSY